MIRRLVARLLGLFLARFRRPANPGNITVFDEVSGETLKLYWRADSMMETQFFRYGLYGSWERHSLRLWAHACRDSQEIVDIGANTGIYSLLARKNNPKATIVAIEPIPLNADILQVNIDSNTANVLLERVAISDKDGEATMFMIKDQLNYMTSVDDDRYAKHPEIAGKSEVIPIKVPIRTWEGTQNRLGLAGPDLIKIDVEGHEVNVLNSMRNHIERNLPTILLEIIGDDNATEINQMFSGIGYTFIAIDENTRSAKIVGKLWDNDHQNFLICGRALVDKLTRLGLVDNLNTT